MPYKRNPYKFLRRKSVAVSLAEWNFAELVGKSFEVPISAHAVLHHAIVMYLRHKATEIRAKETQEFEVGARRYRGPMPQSYLTRVEL